MSDLLLPGRTFVQHARGGFGRALFSDQHYLGFVSAAGKFTEYILLVNVGLTQLLAPPLVFLLERCHTLAELADHLATLALEAIDNVGCACPARQSLS